MTRQTETSHGKSKTPNRRLPLYGHRRVLVVVGRIYGMGEIVEKKGLKPINDNDINGDDDPKTTTKNTVEIVVRTVGPARPSRLRVPSSIKVHELRKLMAGNNHLPIENLRLILRGNVLHDSKNGEDACLQLNNGDSLIVAVKPKPPSKILRDGFDDDDDEEDLKFQLPQSSSRWKRTLYCFLHDKLTLPDILLMAIFSLSLKAWIIIIMWFILAPVANRWGLGPLYILGTGFVIILLNLGKRQPGDVSAYSIFNEDFQELPGTLNADRLDGDIRAGRF
ncbi:hypothetical protein L484_023302 [Morus notabilis]|uniref:Ubiquitin-like domain-containing protein n=1 Tax=Morus notabilis TaxID=981085 RepID=W9SCU4_9ROSA|nr:uncharacterized protein LOC21406071 [Morus notabilis]EXB99771.1 hypothetical protein L484_023302 [Morus notabilis]